MFKLESTKLVLFTLFNKVVTCLYFNTSLLWQSKLLLVSILIRRCFDNLQRVTYLPNITLIFHDLQVFHDLYKPCHLNFPPHTCINFRIWKPSRVYLSKKARKILSSFLWAFLLKQCFHSHLLDTSMAIYHLIQHALIEQFVVTQRKNRLLSISLLLYSWFSRFEIISHLLFCYFKIHHSACDDHKLTEVIKNCTIQALQLDQQIKIGQVAFKELFTLQT